MKKEALFLPIVNLSSEGRVTIDWSGSFSHTTDEEGNEDYDDDELTEEFDRILGGGLLKDTDQATVLRLRNLADYIESQGGGG